ncbi:6705_t:CDS:2 [Dentiscutata erythropus]|uniref:6705_t:CDS:1 n=1 Tax=Dentiscutata erythropus TaxID=1348616 RepID=A0A9N9C192_9GLOM|nr:6705_t:CDS:2 [Dentiscutata erythropus]
MEIETSKSAHEREETKDVLIDLHKGYPITQIDCSPNMKYVATLSEFDRSVILWSIIYPDKQGDPNLRYENTIPVKNIDVGSETSTTFTVSDDGCVAVKLRGLNPRNFEIYNNKAAKPSPLDFPYLHNNISHLSFIDDGNLVMVSSEDHKVYILYQKKKYDNIKWILQSMLELKNFNTSDKIYITSKGKLIIFKNVTHEITIWNLKSPIEEQIYLKSPTEVQILLDWNLNFEGIGLSDDEEMLGVTASSSKLTYLYIFSTRNGMNLSSRTYKKSGEHLVMIDGIHFIASNFGERVLITSHVHYILERVKMDLNVHRFHDEKRTFNYRLMDPYTLTEPVNAGKLFRCLEAKINPPYMIKSDNIIYAIDEQLFIKNLIKENCIYYLSNDLKDSDDWKDIWNNYSTNNSKKDLNDDDWKKIWINYLRHNLNDNNKISTPPDKKEIIDFIIEVCSEKKVIQGKMEYEDKKNLTTKWTLYCKDVTFTLEALPDIPEIPRKIKREQKANMYVRGCKVLKNGNLVMISNECVILWTFIPLKGISVQYIWSIYDSDKEDALNKYWRLKFDDSLAERFLPQSDFKEIIKAAKQDKDITNLYNLLLEDYIEKNFFLTYYGEVLMKEFLDLNKDWLVEKLCKSCIKKCSYNDECDDLLSNFQLLSIIAQFYSELVQKNPAIIYEFLSKMAFVVPSTEIDDVCYNTLSSSPHLHHYVRDIQNGKWTTIEKPVTSPLLFQIIHIEGESEISQIKEELQKLTGSFSEFAKEIKTKLDK